MSAPAAPARSTPILRAVARTFPGRCGLSLSPGLRIYLEDLTRPYGVGLHEDLLAEGSGHTYGQMAEALMHDALPPGETVDVLILAHAVPGMVPGRTTALHLSSLLPGDPFAFGVCDQGIAASYTALRLAVDYARTADRQQARALIIFVEQAALPYEYVPQPLQPNGAGDLPDHDAGVALLYDTAGANQPTVPDLRSVLPGPAVHVRHETEVAPDALPERLAKRFAALVADRPRSVFVLGGGLAAVDTDGASTGKHQVVRAPAGAPFTGAWSKLAVGLASWAARGCSVIVADYDRRLRTLCFCVIDTCDQPHPDGQPQAQPHKSSSSDPMMDDDDGDHVRQHSTR